MIRRHEPDTIRVIHPVAHTRLAGRIAAHWTGSHFKLSPREELILAARRLHGAPFDSDDQLQDGAAYEPLALAIVGG